MDLDLADPRPAYVQLADFLRQLIADGTYPVGGKLPSIRDLATEHSVATATASKALDVLRRDGLILSRAGFGTVVQSTGSAVAPGVQEQLDDLRVRVEKLEGRRRTNQ